MWTLLNRVKSFLSSRRHIFFYFIHNIIFRSPRENLQIIGRRCLRTFVINIVYKVMIIKSWNKDIIMVINKYTNRRTLLEDTNFGQISNAKKTLRLLETDKNIILAVLPLLFKIANTTTVQRNYPYVLIVKCNKSYYQNVIDNQSVKCRS